MFHVKVKVTNTNNADVVVYSTSSCLKEENFESGICHRIRVGQVGGRRGGQTETLLEIAKYLKKTVGHRLCVNRELSSNIWQQFQRQIMVPESRSPFWWLRWPGGRKWYQLKCQPNILIRLLYTPFATFGEMHIS